MTWFNLYIRWWGFNRLRLDRRKAICDYYDFDNSYISSKGNGGAFLYNV